MYGRTKLENLCVQIFCDKVYTQLEVEQAIKLAKEQASAASRLGHPKGKAYWLGKVEALKALL